MQAALPQVRGLSVFGVELGFLVEEYAGSRGSFPPKPRKNKWVILSFFLLSISSSVLFSQEWSVQYNGDIYEYSTV